MSKRERIEIDHYSEGVKQLHRALDGNYLNEQLENWGYVEKKCKQFKRGSNRYDCDWVLTEKGKKELELRGIVCHR